MTFAGKLRLALILAAIVPSLLIAVIVGLAVSEQIKRIEYRDAEAALVRFDDLLGNQVARLEENLINISTARDFQMMEIGYRSRGRIDAQYRLPQMMIDFIEYTDQNGKVLLSYNRPALVGQNIVLPAGNEGDSAFQTALYRYENDLQGSHPAIVVALLTEAGFLVGGVYLDGRFGALVSAVMRADIVDLDTRAGIGSMDIGDEKLYRHNNDLRAKLINKPQSEYQLEARFHPIDRAEIFSGFLTAIAAVLLFSLVVVISASIYFSSQTKKQIKALTDGAARVASGDFTDPIVEYSSGELADLAESFNRMMRQLNDYRDRLIITQKIAAWQSIGRKIAHEVKNPLTPISIAADDIRRSYVEKQKDFGEILDSSTATIKREIERLKKLINEFSSFARMPAPVPVKTGLGTIFEEIRILYRDEIEQKRLTIETAQRNDEIIVDPDQFRQLLINLIKNAIEAGGQSVKVRFNAEGDSLLLTVEDNGPGFPQKLLDDGVTPYFSTKTGGSGLGLVICQRIVLDHDGSMKIENIAEGGARVIIALPQHNA